MWTEYPLLCMVTGGQLSGRGRPEAAAALLGRVAAAGQAGVAIVQIREPGLESRALHQLVTAAVRAVAGTPARIVVNDRADIAMASGAHGVHLKESSMPLARVRAWLPPPFIVGRSIHRAEDAAGEAADYLVFGSVFETASKRDQAPAGVHALQDAVRAASVPVLAIGGVTEERLPAVRAAGAAGFAAIAFFAIDPASMHERCGAARRAFDTPQPVP